MQESSGQRDPLSERSYLIRFLLSVTVLLLWTFSTVSPARASVSPAEASASPAGGSVSLAQGASVVPKGAAHPRGQAGRAPLKTMT